MGERPLRAAAEGPHGNPGTLLSSVKVGVGSRMMVRSLPRDGTNVAPSTGKHLNFHTTLPLCRELPVQLGPIAGQRVQGVVPLLIR